jgi:hypothetical protein
VCYGKILFYGKQLISLPLYYHSKIPKITKKKREKKERKSSHFGVKILTGHSFKSIVTSDENKLAQRRAFGFSPIIL